MSTCHNLESPEEGVPTQKLDLVDCGMSMEGCLHQVVYGMSVEGCLHQVGYGMFVEGYLDC